jgi:hypothetical protein
MALATLGMPSNGVNQNVKSYRIPQTIQPQIFIMIHQSSLQIEWLVYLSYASTLDFNILHELGGGNVKEGLGTSKHLWVNAAKLIP